jgi:hypothetical protein
MHGETIDWVVLNTVENGLEMPTGETHLGGPIKNYLKYKIVKQQVAGAEIQYLLIK